MNRETELRTLALTLVEEFYENQGQGVLNNLNKRTYGNLSSDKDKVLQSIRESLSDFQDENGNEMTEEDKDLVLSFVNKEIWGYGLIDELIHDKTISDIKIHDANHIRIKREGKRESSAITFPSEESYERFVTRLLERNKVNLGTANAIQTFTDADQDDFILRLAVISGLLIVGGSPCVVIRKIPKDKYSLIGMKRGRKEYEMKRESHVKKVMAALLAAKGSAVITVDDIWKNQHMANDSMTLSKDQIWDVMAAMEDASYLEDLTEYEADYKEAKYSSVEQQGIIDDFMKDMSIYPEYEMYIYLQSLRLRLDETTNKEIACDKRLIDLCKASPEARDKVIYERIVIERPKSGIAPNSEFDEYVSTTYIETTYRRIDRNVKASFIKKNLEETDMLAILNHLINM